MNPTASSPNFKHAWPSTPATKRPAARRPELPANGPSATARGTRTNRPSTRPTASSPNLSAPDPHPRRINGRLEAARPRGLSSPRAGGLRPQVANAALPPAACHVSGTQKLREAVPSSFSASFRWFGFAPFVVHQSAPLRPWRPLRLNPGLQILFLCQMRDLPTLPQALPGRASLPWLDRRNPGTRRSPIPPLRAQFTRRGGRPLR